jgi:phosphoribosylanthranilate isomerase
MKERKMKIKVCGMRNPGNIRAVSALNPDYMGFIYYPRSRRYAPDLSAEDIAGLSPAIIKTGVFVNSPAEEVEETCRRMGFTAVQLHGDETPELCSSLMVGGLELIKAFRVGPHSDFGELEDYRDACDLFLLDTAGTGFGGTGRKFEWRRLEQYRLDKPFILSGGITPRDAERILEIRHPGLYGIDLNSGFETSPGIKDPDALEGFIQDIRNG